MRMLGAWTLQILSGKGNHANAVDDGGAGNIVLSGMCCDRDASDHVTLRCSDGIRGFGAGNKLD